MPVRNHIRADRRDGLLRLLHVAGKLRRNEPFSASGEARELGLARKTLTRDVETLRTMGWVIEWDSLERTYVLVSAPRPRLL